MIRTVLVDDDPVTLLQLELLLSEQPDVEVLRTFTNAHEALEHIGRMDSDLVFLDIEMPDISGIEFAAELTRMGKGIDIVFVTSYGQYAIEAFNLNAMHYILKPFSTEMVITALNRVRAGIRRRGASQNEIGITLFGGLRIVGENGPLPIKWITAKTEELFALLILKKNHGVSKWEILESLWPDCDPKRAHQNLYTTIFRVKKIFNEIGMKATILQKGGIYYLNAPGIHVDLEMVESYFERNPEVNSVNVSTWEGILMHFREDLFGDRGYDWSIPAREYYSDLFIKKTKGLVCYYLNAGMSLEAARILKFIINDDYDPELVNLRKQCHI